MIQEVRIKNFRSIKNLKLKLGMMNVLIGANNSGKSNFLRAVDITINGNQDVSEEDIYQGSQKKVSKTDKAIIDIKIQPVNESGEVQEEFNDSWIGVFTDDWISTNDEEAFVGIRAIIEFNKQYNEYVLERIPLSTWGQSIDDAKEGKPESFNKAMRTYLNSFFMDAHRDVVEDIRNKRSYFGKSISQFDLDELTRQKLEKRLNRINKDIIDSIPSIKDTAKELNEIGTTLSNQEGQVKIEPVTRSINDFHKGMDITFKDGKAASFSIAQHGMGTRSWISFLTLSAYVDWFTKQVQQDDEAESYVMLELEEPEAHLHPQAQKQLYEQITNFHGQKIVSTHSPSIVVQAQFNNLIHFIKIDGETFANNFDISIYQNEDLRKIRRDVLRTRGELLFSRAIILCEGITEEQALSIYFEETFGINPIYCGISIISVSGQEYKAFLNLIKTFAISWFIFSDGESKTITNVRSAVKVMSTKRLEDMKNVVILPDGQNYERYLIASGYGDIIVEAINQISSTRKAFKDFIIKSQKVRNPELEGADAIYNYKLTNYPGGKEEAIYDCCYNNKAKYSEYIAEAIIAQDDQSKRVPLKIQDLFNAVGKELNIKTRGESSNG
jgi:putative ATP-dependent endonuclease of OLD family